MRARDSFTATNIAADSAIFELAGGLYGVDAKATWGGGSMKLQKLLADGSTYVSVSTATDFAADGYATVNLPAGTYKFTRTNATAIYLSLARIPSE